MTLTREPDGFFHPSAECELIGLVNLARRAGRKIRVHGSGHSVAHAIFADPLEEIDNRVDPRRTPAAHENIDILLDRYRKHCVDPDLDHVVVVQAGMHLGAAPDHLGGEESDGLLYCLNELGWTLPATGGITHQTVSGFIATASAGGSLKYSFDDSIYSVRLIDGNGAVHDVRYDDPRFGAMVPNLGVLGIVSTISLKCDDAFNIEGEEAIVTATGNRVVDLFGSGAGALPSLSEYLTEQQYARIEWWPQGREPRVVLWTSSRMKPTPDFKRRPYVQFEYGEIEQAVVGVVFTLLGKLDLHGLLPAQVMVELEERIAQLGPEERREAATLARRLGSSGEHIAWLFEDGPADTRARYAAEGFVDPIKRTLPTWFPKLLDMFVPLHKALQMFQDEALHGLPTDLAAQDKWIPVEFTEIWAPLPMAKDVMRLVRDYFDEPASWLAKYERTGTFAFELYAHKPSSFWLHPAHSNGSDRWQHGAFRFNVYWFARNAADPVDEFFPSFWDLLREAGIPFRLHWGKFIPKTGDDQNWQHVRTQYGTKWDEFLELRQTLDPHGIFLNSYWADHLGIDVSAKLVG